MRWLWLLIASTGQVPAARCEMRVASCELRAARYEACGRSVRGFLVNKVAQIICRKTGQTVEESQPVASCEQVCDRPRQAGQLDTAAVWDSGADETANSQQSAASKGAVRLVKQGALLLLRAQLQVCNWQKKYKNNNNNAAK